MFVAIIYIGRLGFRPNGNFRNRQISGLNFSRYPPGAVNSPVTNPECYREIRRHDPKICRNNNVPVDPFALAADRPGATGKQGDGLAGDVRSAAQCRLETAAGGSLVLITLGDRKTRKSISAGPSGGGGEGVADEEQPGK